MTCRRIIASPRSGPEVLQVVEAPLPEPGLGQVRVRIQAAGVSYADILGREGVHPEMPTGPFTPGWDSNARALDTFTDVRELQRQLKAQGVVFQVEADESTTGPASFVVVDPDGNPILVDQHV